MSQKTAATSKQTRQPSSASGGKSTYLSRQAKPKQQPAIILNESDLLKQATISPEDVMKLTRATESKRAMHSYVFIVVYSHYIDYLCPLEANVYNIEFTKFKIRDLESDQTLFEVSKLPDDVESEPSRFVRYHFPSSFLDLRTIGAT